MLIELLQSETAFGSYFLPVTEYFDDVKQGMKYRERSELSRDSIRSMIEWYDSYLTSCRNWQSIGALKEAFEHLERTVHIIFYVIDHTKIGPESVNYEEMQCITEHKNKSVDKLINLYLERKEARKNYDNCQIEKDNKSS